MTLTTAPTLRELNDLDALAEAINSNARAKGFWDDDRDMGEMLMLAVSELAEALEAHRNGEPVRYLVHDKSCLSGCPLAEVDDASPGCCTPKPEGAAVELADCIIRCLDTMHSLDGVNINEEVDAAEQGPRSRLPENFAAALLAITKVLGRVEDAMPVDQPYYLAVAILRCDELIRRLGESPDAVVGEKMHYNTTRPHRHGKAY